MKVSVHGGVLPIAIDISAVSDFDDKDDEPFVGDRVDNPVIADAQPLDIVSAQLYRAGGAGFLPRVSIFATMRL